MLPLTQPGLTVPAVAGRGLNEWLGRAERSNGWAKRCLIALPTIPVSAQPAPAAHP